MQPVRRSGGRAARTANPERGLAQRLPFAIFVAVSFGLLIFSKIYPTLNEQVQGALIDVAAPVVDVLGEPVTAIRGFGTVVADTLNGAEKVEALRAENERLQRWRNVAMRLDGENAQLRALMRVSDEKQIPSISTRVVSDPGGPFVRAILLDPEARNDTATPTSGRLRDPILHLTSLVRALNGQITPANQLSWELSQMSQMPLTPPSVFGFYPPTYRVAQAGGVFGPEFQIYAPTEAVLRGNLFWQVITNPGASFTIDLTPFTTATSSVDVINRIDQALLYGRMPQAMRQSLANVMAAQSSPLERVHIALYLTAISGLYAVQY